jgi:hypothetical protein
MLNTEYIFQRGSTLGILCLANILTWPPVPRRTRRTGGDFLPRRATLRDGTLGSLLSPASAHCPLP